MLALKVTDVKGFFGKLLFSETFDGFDLEKFEVAKAASFVVEGRTNGAWFASDKAEKSEGAEGGADGVGVPKFVKWSEVRPVAQEIIKGKRTPLRVRGTFRVAEEGLAEISENFGKNGVSAAFTVRFENGELAIITGVSAADPFAAKKYE